MSNLSAEEEQKILESAPKGTFTLMLLVGLAMGAGWLFFFFGLFLPHGTVN